MQTPEDNLTIIVQTEDYAAGRTTLPHGSGKTASVSDVFVLIRKSDDKRRYYLSSVITRAAFRELTENKATMETLTTNFNGRDQGDMQIFLAKNYVVPKPVVAEKPAEEAAAA